MRGLIVLHYCLIFYGILFLFTFLHYFIFSKMVRFSKIILSENPITGNKCKFKALLLLFTNSFSENFIAYFSVAKDVHVHTHIHTCTDMFIRIQIIV